MSGPVAAPTYSIIIPTYNEAKNVAVLTWLLIRELHSLGVSHELVFVDDASPDGTADVVRRLQVTYGVALVHLVCRPAKLGLGTAYAAGLERCSGEFVLLMDADFSHHPKYVGAFIAAQRRSQADVVSGSRYLRGGGVAGWSLVRKITSRGANLLASTLLGASTSDLTGAYRLYRRSCLQALLPVTRSRGYAFQMEVIVRAQYLGMRITEVPIVFVDRLFGESKLGANEYLMFAAGLLRLMWAL